MWDNVKKLGLNDSTRPTDDAILNVLNEFRKEDWCPEGSYFSLACIDWVTVPLHTN